MTGWNLARFVVLAAIWGASFLFIKVALEGMSAAQVVLVRLVSGALVLGAVVAARGEALPRERRIWSHLAFLAVIANVVPFLLIAWAEERISSSLAGVLNATTPFTTALVSLLAPHPGESRATWETGVGLGLGFAGVVVVLRPWGESAGTSMSGELACLLAAACYGVAFVYSKRFVVGRGHSTVGLAASQLGLAAAIMLMLAPAIARGPVDLAADVAASVLVLGAVGTGAAYLLYYGLIANVGATTASMVTYAIPIGAVALGVVVLDEPMTWNLVLGGAVVVLGIAIADGRLSRPARPPPVGELDVESA